jgi:NAD(P)H-flavin reductase
MLDSADMQLVPVTRVWDETPTLRGVIVDAGDLARGHIAPGQYVKARLGEAEGFFALASAPGEPLEILVKKAGALAPGDRIGMSAPHGAGYPVAAHEGRDLLLFAAGTGIAPIRAVVHQVLRARPRFGAVRLWHGQRAASELAYAREHDAWRAAGVEIVPVVSGADPGWEGARGYVQDVLRAAPPPLARAVAYVCGMKEMEDGVIEVLVGLGMPRDDVHRNY